MRLQRCGLHCACALTRSLSSLARSGEFDNAGAMMTVDENLMCSFQILKPAEKKPTGFGGLAGGRPSTPPRSKLGKPA